MELRVLTPACVSCACDVHEECSEVVVIVNSTRDKAVQCSAGSESARTI